MEYKVTDEHINEYISGELDGEELVEFEKLLSKDENLQKQLKIHQQIDAVLADNYFEINSFNQDIYEKEKANLSPILEKLEHQHFDEEIYELQEVSFGDKGKRKPSIVRMLIPLGVLAAAATILLFIINPFSKNLTSPEIADLYFKPYTESTYRNGNNNLNSPEALLAKGSEYYQNENLEQAITTFKKVIEKSSAAYANEAKWYLALCYLKQNKPEIAKPLLIELQKESNYTDKTKEILERLS